MPSYKILMAEYQPWNSRIQDGDHKYGRFFLEDGNQVVWLANFTTVNRLLRRREDDEVYNQNWRQGWQTLEPDLFTFTPFTFLPYVKFPFLDREWAASVCLQFTWPHLGQTLRQQGFHEVDLLWIGNPRLISVIKSVRSRAIIYRMSDDVGQFKQEPASIDQVEARLCTRADLVVATAKSLVEKACQYSDNVLYLPNGVDFELFRHPDLTIPRDLEAIPKPRLLYVGIINDWVDFEMLAYLADARPNYSLVMVGPNFGSSRAVSGLNELARRANVYILGSRPFQDVRRYMRFSEVGLVPFIFNQLTHGISPIKMFEYFAAGLPVVASKLDEIKNLSSPALLYSCPQDILARVDQAVREGAKLSPQSIDFARNNSWRTRYTALREAIEMILQLKG